MRRVLPLIVALGLGACAVDDLAVVASSDNLAAPDLAAGKVATQSTTAYGGSASRAVDGNADGRWDDGSVTHTLHEVRAWWQVDLGEVSSLAEVVLYNRTDCCSDRLADFDLLLSSDGVGWRTAISYNGAAPGRLPLLIHGAARFVRVQLRGAGFLSLAEVEVFARSNLAAGKAASQSSTAYDSPASLAVDGNRDGELYRGSVSHTQHEPQAWWQVDLDAVTSIGEVILYNRTDCCSEQLVDFDVLLSDDGATWRTALSHEGAAPAQLALSIDGPARFVRVQLRGTGPLSLAEVEVFARPNLAAGKAASQSSTEYDSPASLAVDGDVDGNWHHGSVTHTAFEKQAWWQVDLGAPSSIGQVILYNRTDCCSDRLRDFDLLVSDDGASWRTVARYTGVALDRLPLAVDRSGRFVRVQLRYGDALSLAEVQVLP